MHIHWSEDKDKGSTQLWFDGVLAMDKKLKTKGPEGGLHPGRVQHLCRRVSRRREHDRLTAAGLYGCGLLRRPWTPHRIE